MVQVVCPEHQSAVRNPQARIFLGPSQVVGVLELHHGRRAHKVPRLPVGLQHEFFEGLGRRHGAFQQPDAARARLAQEVHRRADDLRMSPVGQLERQVSQAIGGQPREIDLDGDSLSFDEPLQAAQLIEHGREHLDYFGAVNVATSDRHRSRRRAAGKGEPGRRHAYTRHRRAECPEELSSRAIFYHPTPRCSNSSAE